MTPTSLEAAVAPRTGNY